MKNLSITHVGIGFGFILLAIALLLPTQPKSVQMTNKFDRIAAALEAYALDNGGVYPFNTPDYHFRMYQGLTTPVAYLAPEDLMDPFPAQQAQPFIRYINIDQSIGNSQITAWRAQYPHYLARHGHWIIWSGSVTSSNPETGLPLDFIPYDPTNGTLRKTADFRSFTGSFRSQKMTRETGHN